MRRRAGTVGIAAPTQKHAENFGFLYFIIAVIEEPDFPKYRAYAQQPGLKQ
jgi:hypothetical protein